MNLKTNYIIGVIYMNTMISDTEKDMIVDYCNTKYVDGFYAGLWTGITVVSTITIVGMIVNKIYK